MLTESPWVSENNPLKYMESGARTGLEQRGQNLGFMEAGQRLKLAYDSLQANQDAQRRADAIAASANAAAMLRQREQDSINNLLRMGHLQTEQERLGQFSAAQKIRSQTDQDKLNLARQVQAFKETRGAGVDPFSRMDYSRSGQHLNELQKQLDALGPSSQDPEIQVKQNYLLSQIEAAKRQMGALKQPTFPAQSLAESYPTQSQLAPTTPQNTITIGDQIMPVEDYVARLHGQQPSTTTLLTQPPSSAAAPKSAPQASPPPGTLRNGRTFSIVPVGGQSATQPSVAPSPTPQARPTPAVPITVTKPDTDIKDEDVNPLTLAGLGAFAPKPQQRGTTPKPSPAVDYRFNSVVQDILAGEQDSTPYYLAQFPPEQRAAQQKKLQDAVDAIKSDQAKKTANSERMARNTKNSADFERVATIAHWPSGEDRSKPGGFDSPEVKKYLSQFTPEQRAVRLKALKQRAKEILDKENSQLIH